MQAQACPAEQETRNMYELLVKDQKWCELEDQELLSVRVRAIPHTVLGRWQGTVITEVAQQEAQPQLVPVSV